MRRAEKRISMRTGKLASLGILSRSTRRVIACSGSQHAESCFVARSGSRMIHHDRPSAVETASSSRSRLAPPGSRSDIDLCTRIHLLLLFFLFFHLPRFSRAFASGFAINFLFRESSAFPVLARFTHLTPLSCYLYRWRIGISATWTQEHKSHPCLG